MTFPSGFNRMVKQWGRMGNSPDGRTINREVALINITVSKWIGAIALLLFLTVPAGAGPAVKVGYVEFPPVFYTDSTGNPRGTLIELMGKVMKEAGYAWDAASYPTERMAKYLARGEIHLWVGSPSLPAFKGTTLVGATELMKIVMRSYFINDTSPIRARADLRGKKVIILNGYGYGGWINFIKEPANKVSYSETNTHESAFRMLKAGRADYLLDYKRPSDKVLRKIPVPGLAHSDITAFGVHFVVSKKAPAAGKLLENLENAYNRLVGEGIIQLD